MATSTQQPAPAPEDGVKIGEVSEDSLGHYLQRTRPLLWGLFGDGKSVDTGKRMPPQATPVSAHPGIMEVK